MKNNNMQEIPLPLPIPVTDMSSGLPSPDESLYWELKEKRVYWIDYEITDNYDLLTLAKEIIRLNKEEASIAEPEPITLYIHSYGGDLDQAQFFCDLIESSHVPVVTVAAGVAMSAGLLIFLSGKKRYAFKHSQLLMHQGSASFSGTAEEIESAQKSYKKKLEKMKKYILSHTSIDSKLFEKNKTKDWYVSGEELLTLGIADKIIENFSDIKL
jgi:ATP-dependent Clp protease protease subunit